MNQYQFFTPSGKSGIYQFVLEKLNLEGLSLLIHLSD